MKEISKKNLLSVAAVFSFVAFCFAIAQTFGSSYAYVESDCPTGYSLVSGTNQCYGKPTYSCTKGTYDDDEGWCYYDQACPTGYTLATNNQCIKEPNVKYSCTKGTYDDDEGWCYYEQACPTGYTLATNNHCIANPNNNNGTYSCTYGDYDEDEGYCNYYLTTPEGFEIFNKTTTTMTYGAKPKTEYSCTKGTYDDDEGYCNYYLTTPEGFEIFNKTTTTMTYGAKPKFNCTYGDYDEDEGWCYYYLTGGSSSGTTTPTTYKVYFGSITDYNAKFYKNGTVTTTYTQPVSGSSINLKDYTASSDNWEFNGWTYGYNSDGSCQDILPNTLTLTKETTNVYACWTKKTTTTPTTETIEIVANAGAGYISYVEGVNNLDEDTKTYKQTCSISDTKTKCKVSKAIEAEREGYIFNGWGTNSICTNGKEITELDFSKNTTVHACWEEATEEYDVKFNTNGGTLYRNNNKSTTSIYALVKLNYSEFTAKKDGYIFKGWRTSNQTCNNAVKTGSLSLEANLELYACYEQEKSEITENPATGSTILYLIILIGVLSLGYTGYSIYRYIKSKK